jgi:divinyl chlorophyllide a 8-vinyl-reductase
MAHPAMVRRVMLLGATGTIGRAAAAAIAAEGHQLVCFVRPGAAADAGLPSGCDIRFGQVTDPSSLRHDGFRGEHFDVLVSCLASRSGVPADAWKIDHRAHVDALAVAKAAGVGHMVLLSAICVQKPKLAFQYAKLAFENELIGSGLAYSIVRPTAYFKSLSGQIGRLQQGKPYLLFGNGQITATKPISDGDLGRFIARCISDPQLHDRVLPVGGPGEATTPRQQGEALFALLGRKPHFRHVPVALLDVIAATLTVLGRFSTRLADKAELARIGRYYATESMLVWDAAAAQYDAAATPSFGNETLGDFHARVVNGEVMLERGEHAVF